MEKGNASHSEVTQAMAEKDAPPFFIASMVKATKCEKCGMDVTPPGRLTIFDGMVSKTWCDCITEQEMNDLAVQFEALWRMWTMNPLKAMDA